MKSSALKASLAWCGTIVASCLLISLPLGLFIDSLTSPVSLTATGICGAATIVCIGIVCGSRIAYFAAQCLYGMIAILFGFDALNPMVYHEVLSNGNEYTPLIWVFLRLTLIALISGTLCWSLGEHLKLPVASNLNYHRGNWLQSYEFRVES